MFFNLSIPIFLYQPHQHMENTESLDLVVFDHETANNRLSFSDFTIYNQNQEPNSSFLDIPYQEHHPKAEVFNFSTTATNIGSTNKNIIFCGRIINTNEYYTDQTKSAALHSKPVSHVPSVPKLKSSNSKKHSKVLIGLAKVPTRMELSDIKKRQSRLAPAPLFRGVVEEQAAAAAVKLRRRSWSFLLSPLAKTCFAS